MATALEMSASFKKHVDSLKVHRDQVEGPSLKKPLLLLLVISRLHRGQLRENRIRFTDLEKELSDVIREFCWKTLNASPSPEQPFERLASSAFWTLHVPSGATRGARKALPRTVLRDPNTYAQLEDGIFRWLQGSSDARKQATQILLDRWCPPEKQAAIRARLALP